MASLVDYESDLGLTDLEEEDDDHDSLPILLKNQEKSSFAKFREVVAELQPERKAREDLENSMIRVKSFAHEEQVKKIEQALKEKEQTFRSEIEVASQILVSGIEEITRKVSSLNLFSSDELPISRECSVLPNLAYQTIKRTNDVVEQLLNQIKSKSNDQERNYETAVDVSPPEATISGLREENAKKVLEKEMVQEKLNLAEKEIDEYDSKLKLFESKIEAQRRLVNEQFSYLTKIHEQVCSVIKIVDDTKSDDSEWSNAVFLKEEMDMEENLRDTLAGMEYIYELTKIIVKKLSDQMVKRTCETKSFNEKVAQLTREKQLFGSLLRSVLSRRFGMSSSSEMSEALKVAEDGLREVGLDIKFSNAFGNGDNTNSLGEQGGAEMLQDEGYTLAGAMENIVWASQLEITELQHSLEELRAESCLLKAHVEAQAKELSQRKRHTEELAEKERLANQNVEGLVMDITATGEVIKKWKLAAEQEAAAGRAVEHDFKSQLSVLRQELNDAKEAMIESEKKMKLKEEKATAAMALRDAAEESLRLADFRNSKQRERLEDVSRQLESVTHNDLPNKNRWRYACWPWQWLGMNSVGYHLAETQELNSTQRELSEPLV